jgi:predicted DNA-binding protein
MIHIEIIMSATRKDKAMMADNSKWEATFVAFTKEQKQMLKQLARQENRSMSGMIRHLIEQALKHRDEPHRK